MSVIEFQKVSKAYSVYLNPHDRLTELLTFNQHIAHRLHWALVDVSFTVERGETFCFIGENGSGKSTLLQIVAGILRPTSGDVSVQGRVASLLELGSGFNPQFSGRDNVYLNAAVLGFSRTETDELYDKICAFAEIGDFIDQPVKNYSTGMAMRLAFAVAIHADPDILVIDEALAVGDLYFRQRCLRRMQDLRNRGVTILFVSHATSDVKAIGDRCLWLDKGRVRKIGPANLVTNEYAAAMGHKDLLELNRYEETDASLLAAELNAPPTEETHLPNVDGRFGNGKARITGIGLYDEFGTEAPQITPGARLVVRLTFQALASIRRPIAGFLIRNHLGMEFTGTSTQRESIELPSMQAGQSRTVDFHIDVPELYSSALSFSPAISEIDSEICHVCDWVENATTVEVMHKAGQVYGFLHVPCKIETSATAAEMEFESIR